MNENILISVIVPVYNLQNYIQKCLDSICMQTHKNIEIIVVDDGSNDNSFNIIQRYAKSDTRIVPVTQTNSGVVEARRNGLKHSTGDFIGFVDGDDTIEHDMYETLLDILMENNADISHCGYTLCEKESRCFFHGTMNKQIQNNILGLKELLSGKWVEPGIWNKLYKKSTISAALFNPKINNLKNLEDLLINYYAFKNSKLSVFYDVCKYNYIKRENSASDNNFNECKYNDPYFVFLTIIDDCKSQPELYTIAFGRLISFLVHKTTDKTIPKTFRKDSINKLLQYNSQIKSSAISKKLKLMANISSRFPELYVLVRRCYEHLNLT